MKKSQNDTDINAITKRLEGYMSKLDEIEASQEFNRETNPTAYCHNCEYLLSELREANKQHLEFIKANCEVARLNGLLAGLLIQARSHVKDSELLGEIERVLDLETPTEGAK